MMKAIIFDCDGILAETEPLHFAALQSVLAAENISLTNEAYLHEFLALDDRGCFTKAFAKIGRVLSKEKLAALIARKAATIEPVMQTGLHLFPGVQDFVERASRQFPLAIASGALRSEIDLILHYGGLQNFFNLIVSAEDVEHGKPDPESFLKASRLLAEQTAKTIEPHECLVIEDSFHGIHAARSAGMICLAVTNTYSREILAEADMVTDTLKGLSLEKLATLFEK
ncbi:MAG: HAD family phosphatase [Acidobacteria bacterium]|nr:HAD family phosphatase [Acidobacteriota bacterium]